MMARLLKTPVPGFEQREGEELEHYFKRTQVLLDAMQQESDAVDPANVVGALVKFSVADGYAIYRVVKAKPLTLQHVPFGDGYRISDAHIRGLRLADVQKSVQGDQYWRSLIASKQKERA